MLWQMAMPNIYNGMALFQTIRYNTVRLTSVANNKHAFLFLTNGILSFVLSFLKYGILLNIYSSRAHWSANPWLW